MLARVQVDDLPRVGSRPRTLHAQAEALSLASVYSFELELALRCRAYNCD